MERATPALPAFDRADFIGVLRNRTRAIAEPFVVQLPAQDTCVARGLHCRASMRLAFAAIVVGACGSPSSDTAAPANAAHAVEPTTAPAKTDRKSIDLPGDANGLVWDAATSTLYLTDSTNAQIERWTDAGGFAPVAACPHDGQLSLGGLVRTSDAFVTPSFGFGSAGTVYVVGPGSAARTVPNLDPARRRVGIARAPDGTLYDSWIVAGGGTHHAGVAKLDLATGETDIIELAGKPMGIAATADTLYVSDQDKNEIVAYPRSAPTQAKTIATNLPGVDLLAELPDGDLITGGKKGTVSRIHLANGAVATIAGGFDQVRGVAYDPAGHRLFVVEHTKATSRQHLYVVPYDATRE
jgi:sugar lactone lactonase YvrE